MTKLILGRSLEVIVFIFAAFSSYFLAIAPPGEERFPFVTGLSSMTALAILLFVSAIAKGRRLKVYDKYWFMIALIFLVIAILSAFNYFELYRKYTFSYDVAYDDRDTFISGDVFTRHGQQRSDSLNTTSPEKLVKDFGLEDLERIWTAESISRINRTLIGWYLAMTLGFCITIFCLIEGVLKRNFRR